MDISVIIVSYNVKEFLRGAIQSVERSLAAGNLTGEIFVVDNNSVDESAEMVRREFPAVHLHALTENRGFGRANNLAMREAQGEFLLLLNPDTIVGEDTLRYMVDFMRANPSAGLSGCKLLNGDGSFQLSCRRGFPTPWASFTKLFGFSRFFPQSRLFAQYNLTYLPVDQTYEVDALGGAFMMMSQPAFQATGGFDEDYFMYGEDLDLCFRVKKAGFAVYYVHGTATIHFKGESTKRSAINELNVFYDAMHIFVKKNYGSSHVFRFLLRLGIVLRTMLALLQKYRGSILLTVVDLLTVALGVMLGTKLLLGAWFALPKWDYPGALLLPPIIAVFLLALLGAYQQPARRSAKRVVLAFPALLVAFSSLTYFFKEFPASRQIVIVVTITSVALLILNRALLRIVDRVRWGGDGSATPVLNRTLIVGTSEEAVRIAKLLKRTEFLRRYEIVGFIDRTLTHFREEILPGIRIVGDTGMLAKVVREQRITEVIFASEALPYSEMLAAMQRVSAQVSRPVNFNMVPSASEVLIGRRKIELLSPASSDLALMPVEYNLHRVSHRIGKRMLDLAVSAVAVPFVSLAAAISPTDRLLKLRSMWTRIFMGQYTLVGVAGEKARKAYFGKPGLTCLAAVSAHQGVRQEDLDQFDHYYAHNHSVGMDCEILLKAFVFRKERTVINEVLL